MKYDHYCFYGSTHRWADLGAPFKVNWLRYQLMRLARFKTVRVPEGTTKEAVILKYIIDSGSHIASYYCERALKEHCDKTIKIEEIEK